MICRCEDVTLEVCSQDGHFGSQYNRVTVYGEGARGLTGVCRQDLTLMPRPPKIYCSREMLHFVTQLLDMNCCQEYNTGNKSPVFFNNICGFGGLSNISNCVT